MSGMCGCSGSNILLTCGQTCQGHVGMGRGRYIPARTYRRHQSQWSDASRYRHPESPPASPPVSPDHEEADEVDSRLFPHLPPPESVGSGFQALAKDLLRDRGRSGMSDNAMNTFLRSLYSRPDEASLLLGRERPPTVELLEREAGLLSRSVYAACPQHTEENCDVIHPDAVHPGLKCRGCGAMMVNASGNVLYPFMYVSLLELAARFVSSPTCMDERELLLQRTGIRGAPIFLPHQLAEAQLATKFFTEYVLPRAQAADQSEDVVRHHILLLVNSSVDCIGVPGSGRTQGSQRSVKLVVVRFLESRTTNLLGRGVLCVVDDGNAVRVSIRSRCEFVALTHLLHTAAQLWPVSRSGTE
jgi:hypothetical protein